MAGMASDSSSKPVGLARAEELLREAARIAVEHDLCPDAFANVAMNAYFAACPALREQIELHATAAQLALLRARGRVGQA